MCRTLHYDDNYNEIVCLLDFSLVDLSQDFFEIIVQCIVENFLWQGKLAKLSQSQEEAIPAK
jgi:hypothetical protein